MPALYDRDDFVEACRNRSAVPWTDALRDADKHFGLRTRTALFDFIVNGGLENLTYRNTEPLKTYKGPGAAPMIDAYNFSSGQKKGYIAFYKGFDGIWILKSFHRDEFTGDLNPAFENLRELLSLKAAESNPALEAESKEK